MDRFLFVFGLIVFVASFIFFVMNIIGEYNGISFIVSILGTLNGMIAIGVSEILRKLKNVKV